MYQPINIKRSTKYGNNYWEAHSPKLNRNVRLFSDLEYDHWILIETDPKVKSFCEQPLCIEYILDGKLISSIIDMWVLYTDNTEHFIEVKYSSELNINNPKSCRSISQTSVQRLWCEKNNFRYVIKTEKDIRSNEIYIENMRTMLPYLRTINQPIETDRARILKIIQNSRVTIAEIESSLLDIPVDRIREAIYHLIYKGIVITNLDKIPLSNKMEVWINGGE